MILTVIDRFSKTVHFIPLPKLPSAKETARVVADPVFWIHFLPEDVVSDRGPSSCPTFGGSSVSSWVHPQMNGQTKRANQDLKQMLRCLATQNQGFWPGLTWSQQLTWAEYAHNSLPVFSTGFPPFLCCLSYQPPLFPSQGAEAAVTLVQAFIQQCVIPGGGPVGPVQGAIIKELPTAAKTVALR